MVLASTALTIDIRDGEVDSVRQGADEILRELIDVHSTSMYRVARSIVVDHALAEDVVQESLFKVWQKAASFRGEASLRSWALSITHNTAISVLRKRREEVRDPTVLPEGDAGPSTDRQVAGQMMVQELWTALDTLDPLSRTVVVLREIEGMTYEERSEILDLPLPTIKTRLFRARKLLSNALAEWR
jgi:RNA polymerase sigma-70 factor, ECF subfamily